MNGALRPIIIDMYDQDLVGSDDFMYVKRKKEKEKKKKGKKGKIERASEIKYIRDNA